MNQIKQLIINQCEKLIEKLLEDQSAAYSTVSFACKSIACGYRWSKDTIHQCQEKLFGRVSNYCDAYRSQMKLGKRRKTLGNFSFVVFLCVIKCLIKCIIICFSNTLYV